MPECHTSPTSPTKNLQQSTRSNFSRMIDNNKIPPSWTIAKLGEVCTYSKGKMPQILKTEKDNECSIPYINIKAFEKGIFAEYTNGVKCNLCDDDDFLMVWNGARCGLIGKAKKGAVGSTLMKILPIKNIHKEYLYYFIKSKFNILNSKPKGVGIPHIEPTLLWNFEFAIPPIPEQHRIVKKIEELFTDLDKGIEYLKTAQQQLKVYRQAVLKWAFEERLTNENIVDSELPKGWKFMQHSEIADINPKLPFEKIEDDTEVSFLPMKLVEEEKNKIHLTEFRKYKEVKKGFTPFTNGDIIFAKITPCMENGKCAILNDLKNEIGIGSTEFHVSRPKENVIAKYIFFFIIQEKFRRDAAKHFTGSVGQKRVPTSFFSDFLIPVPSKSEQEKIIYEIETRLSVCDKIEETIVTSLRQSESLRLSIIKKAFEGKLVKQNPKDEPAEKLLERIRAEKKRNFNGKEEKKVNTKTSKKKIQFI